MLKSVLLINTPLLEPHRPPVSTAILASVLHKNNYHVEVLDLNIKLFLKFNDLYHSIEPAFDNIRRIKYHEIKQIINLLREFLNPICSDFDVIGISVFSVKSVVFSEILMKYTRKYFPNVRIIIGGPGVLGETDAENGFGKKMKQQDLCDAYVVGEGEHTIVSAVEGAKITGVNTEVFSQIDDLSKLPFPNYKFFDLDDYDYLEDKREVLVVGSRGCVRRCTYCNVQRSWPSFKFRTGLNIAEELIYHYETSGVSDFYFADSLINGSRKAFVDMCTILAEYNQMHNAKFSWKGQFIFKRKSQISDEYFDIISEAGGNEFYVGVETGSDKIRWEMDKKFTNDDIQYHLEQFNRTNLKTVFLMLTGYITETLEDHHVTMKMLKRWQYFVATGTIIGIEFGQTLSILPGTPLHDMIDSRNINFLTGMEDIGNVGMKSFWTTDNNISLTIPERVRRRVEIHQQAIKYNWPVWRGVDRLNSIKQLITTYNNHIKNNISINNI